MGKTFRRDNEFSSKKSKHMKNKKFSSWKNPYLKKGKNPKVILDESDNEY